MSLSPSLNSPPSIPQGKGGVKVYEGTAANGDAGLTEDLASVDTFEERSKVFTRFDFTFEGSSYAGMPSPKVQVRPIRARGGTQRRAHAPAVVGFPGSALLCSALEDLYQAP